MSVPAAYFLVVVLWSTTPLAIKWSVDGGGYAFAVMARMLLGAALALALVHAGRGGLPRHTRACRSYLVGGLGIFFAMYCTYWGARYIDSGLVAVLFGLAPLVTSLMAVLWLGEPGLGPGRLGGILLGVAGLAAIFGEGIVAGARPALGGAAAVLLAVLAYSASLVWMKRIGDDSPPLATTAGSLLVSLPLFVLAWGLTDGSLPAEVPLRAGAAIVYLGVFGSVLGFALFYYVVRHLPAGTVALITLITPVVALFLGQVANGEVIGSGVWTGAGLIVLGLVLHQWGHAALARK